MLPNVNYFKPRGIPMADLDEIVLTVDEFEAIRLKDYVGQDQESAAFKMNISQPTIHRLLEIARKKVADAIVNGKGLKIEGGIYELERPPRRFGCEVCKYEWDAPHGTGRPEGCPDCGSLFLNRLSGSH